MASFSLSDAFIDKYKGKQPEWGPLGYITYKRTYARPVPGQNRTEEWWETLQRVVEGTYTIQRRYCEGLKLPWNGVKAQHSAQEMFRLMWEMKFLPPGRGLWMMGTDFVEKRGGAALNNCSFVSTKNLHIEYSEPFCFLMDMSMLGVGVGSDTKGAETIKIREPRIGSYTFVVEDTREGWVELVRTYIDAYFGRGALPAEVDYSKVRPYGTPIKSFGGTASGPAPLQQLAETDIPAILNPYIDNYIDSEAIVDLFNAIGRCVVSGNVRRSAEIMIGDPEDEKFLELKDPLTNKKKLDEWRWASNNSLFAEIGMDYSVVAELTAKNGEPGYLWLDTARNYGRLADPPDPEKDGLAAGCNPCSEQTLESYELCCVTADTRILTRNGYPRIIDVVDKDVEVWNGKEWSTVKPFVAAHDKSIYRVTLSDGSYLDTTNDHEWSARLRTQRNYRRIATKDLQEGMYLESTELDTSDEGNLPRDCTGYQAGWIAGDGYIDSNSVIALVQEPEYAILEELNGREYKEQHPNNYARPFKRVRLPNFPLRLARSLRAKEAGLPEEIFSWDAESLADFFGGWIDTDGCLRKNPKTDHYVLHGNEKRLRDAQLLLRKLGINHASLRKEADQGEATNYGERNYSLWVLLIPSYECQAIRTRLKKATRFGSRFGKNNAHPGTIIDRARKQKVVSVTKLEDTQDVFCFTEPREHKGVFGNVLTYQCLVETFPARHQNFEEYQRTLKFAYLYAKTVTLVPTHNARTNAVMLRNRRIGTSQSGIAQSFRKFGIRGHYQICDDGYRYLRNLDRKYSKWLCIPESIKITSVKPSGTVSLLPGSTPGVHFPYAEYYWRTIRMDAGSQLVEALEKAGYRIEEGEGHNTVVVYFPVKEDNFYKSRSELSIWEQLEIVAQMQYWWADNQVSVTVTFKPEEACQIKQALELYETRLKSVSFLPLTEHGYKHAPYQPMTKEEYEKVVKKLKPVKLKKVSETSGFEHKYCDSERCELTPPQG